MAIQVQIRKSIYIRNGPGRDYDKIGVVDPGGNTYIMDGKETGQSWKGINEWYFKINDKREKQYYWGGGIKESISNGIFAQPLKDLEQETGVKKSFSWFQNLEIENIWSTYNEYGENVTVAVLDTGYNIINEDISPAVIGAGIHDGLLFKELDDVRSEELNDTVGHGTFCASVIAARNIAEYNIGIAPKCKLLIGKISNGLGLKPTGLETIINGIDWAIKKGAEIISISFGKYANEMPGDEKYLRDMQEKLDGIIQGKKVLIFASIGNNNTTGFVERERYPASLTGCISVGATDNGVLSKITELSSKTIIHAQGIDVESYYSAMTPEKHSGTSMAVPIVAAVSALTVSYLKRKNIFWEPTNVLEKIYTTGKPIPGTIGKKEIDPINLFKQL